MQEAIYNKIGKTYDATRKSDPNLVAQIIKFLSPKPDSYYLDLGCGSGNYTGTLVDRGVNISGIDYSEGMLLKARQKYPQVSFYQGNALCLPFESNLFDGAICVLATHHIGNNRLAFAEAYRVIEEGPLIIFTSTPEQMKNYWLCHYFPKMMENSINKMASYDEIKTDLEQAGFIHVEQHKYFITNELQDWFLHAGKYRPEIYLNPSVRNGISTFHLFLDDQELNDGLTKLEADIRSNNITRIISDHESALGDYMFIVGEKVISLP